MEIGVSPTYQSKLWLYCTRESQNIVPSTPSDGPPEEEEVLQRISDGFYALDSNWHFTYVNDRALELLGATREELLNTNLWESFPETKETILYEKYHEALQTQERTRFDIYYEPLETWFRVTVYPSENGLSVYFTDITDVVLMQQAIDSADMGVIITDPHENDNPIIYVNDGFERLTGYENSEIVGRNCRFLQGPNTDPEPVAKMRQAIDKREPITVTLMNYRKSGVPFWNRVSINPVRDSNGTVTHFIGFQQDTTTLVERERRVQLLQRVLRHNLRTELNIILGNLENIDTDSPEEQNFISQARSAGERLISISERVREIDRILEDLPFDPQAVQLRKLISQGVHEAKKDLSEAEIRCDIDYDGEVLGSRGLRRAFTEIISNSLEHGGDGEGVLEITAERVSVPSPVAEEGRPAIRVDFADRGQPLSELERHALVSADEDPLRHGTGLGLWFVHWLVTLSGGRISYSEREGGGNVISFILLLENGDKADREA